MAIFDLVLGFGALGGLRFESLSFSEDSDAVTLPFLDPDELEELEEATGIGDTDAFALSYLQRLVRSVAEPKEQR